MAKRKKPILPPAKPSWDLDRLDDLTEYVRQVVDILDKWQYERDGSYSLINHEFTYSGEGDYRRELKFWLYRLDTLRWQFEMAQYLAQLLPDIPEITMEDIDDDILSELSRFYGHNIRRGTLEPIIEYCNMYYK